MFRMHQAAFGVLISAVFPESGPQPNVSSPNEASSLPNPADSKKNIMTGECRFFIPMKVLFIQVKNNLSSYQKKNGQNTSHIFLPETAIVRISN